MDGPARTDRERDRGAVRAGESGARGSAGLGYARPPGRHQLLFAIGRTVLTVTGLLVLYYVLPLDEGFGGRTGLVLVGGLAVVGGLVAWQVWAILRSPRPALRAIEAVSLSLPLFLLLFAVVYLLLSEGDPGSFTEPLDRTDGLYFVVTVFATVGFGDIAPVTQVARIVTTMQMVGDLVVIGVVLKLFLAAVDRGRRRVAEQQLQTPSDDDS